MCKEILFLIIFFIGEILFNLTWFQYLKTYFNFDETENETKDNVTTNSKKLFFLNLSTFKGIMERFIISIGLVFGFAPILIVFGTIKLGTRFKDNQDVKNDYFLIGNFSSILISILYYYIFKEVSQFYNVA